MNTLLRIAACIAVVFVLVDRGRGRRRPRLAAAAYDDVSLN